MLKKIVTAVVASGFMLTTLTGCRVWQQEREGQAALARARYQAQVMEVEARNRLAAETYNAEAELVRAKGIAAAMEVVNAELTTEYLIHFWIRTMAEHDNVIYVSMTDGLPAFFFMDRHLDQ